MKTTRNSSSWTGRSGRWQTGKRAPFAPSRIVLFIMILILTLGGQKSFGQGVGISEASIAPHSSSILELRSSLRGFLAPRMTTAERTAIATPAQGLLVYDVTTQSFWYFETTWKTIASGTLGSGNQLLGMNAAGTANEYKSLLGTTNRISVTHGIGTITLSTPQDIHTAAAPTFAGLTLSGLTPNSGVYTNGTSVLTSTPPTTGVLGYWQRTGIILSPTTAGDAVTTTGDIYTTSAGTITSSGLLTGSAGLKVTGGKIDLNDNSSFVTNINTGGSTGNITIGNSLNSVYMPKFATAGLVHNDASGLLSTGLLVNSDITNSTIDLTTKVTGILPLINGGTNTDLSGGSAVGDLLTGTATGFARLADAATGNVLLSGGSGVAPLWGKIGLTSHVSGVLPIANGGTNSGTALTGQSIIISNGSAIVQGAAGTSTDVLHGNASGAPTYSQVVNSDIANGTINLTSKVTGILPVLNGGTGFDNTYLDGQLLIGNSSGTLTRNTLTGTLNQINVANGNGTITLSTPQDIHLGAEPTFLGMTLSGLSASAGVYTDASKKLTSAPPLIGTIGYWDRTGTVLSPAHAGDAVTTTGDIYTTSGGAITSSGLLTGSLGATISGAPVNLNSSSDFATNINTGTSAGNVTIGNTLSSLYLKKFTSAGVLHNDASGLVSSGPVSLSADVSNVLPVPNGGTGISDITTNNLIYGNGTNPVNLLAPSGTTGAILTTTATGAPGWLTLNTLPATSGILQVPNGGTGASTLTTHGVVIGNGVLPVNTTATGTAGQVLQSRGGLLDPGYSTAIYPTTTTINQILYSSTADNVTGLATSANGVLITSAGGVPSIGSTLPTAVQGNITSLGTIGSGTWNGSIIGLAYGGTNTNLTLGSPATGDLLYADSPTSFARLADIATGNVLLSGGAGVAPSWGKVDLGTSLTGILPIANGGTNSGTALDGSSIIISDGTSIIQGEKGTTTTVLHGNGSGAPSYGQVVNNDIADGTIDLTSKVVNELPVVNGGTGLTTFGGNNTVLYTSTANNLTNVATSTAAGQFLQTTTSGGAPTWKSVLDVVNGGLGQSSPLVPGGVLYGSTATAAGVTAAGFTGQMLRSTGAGTPIWSTPTYPNSATLGKIMRGDGTNWLETTTTYPNSTTINQLLYSPGDNNIAGLATLNNGVLVTNGTGVPQWANRTDFTSSALTDGHIYVGNSSDVATDVAMSGDATIINSGAVTVGRINGATVPVSGALVPGNVLQVSSASGLSYGPVNLGLGSDHVTGILPVPNGGTGSSTLTTHGVVIGNGVLPVNTTATGTAGQVLQSRGGLLDPGYSTAIYPTTTTINQILYSSTADNVTGLATSANGVLITSAGGVPSIGSTLPTAVQGNITSLGTIGSGTWNGSIIGLAYGGTNTNLTLGSPATGDLLYADSPTSFARLADIATGNVLLSGGAGVAPSWGKVDLGTSLTGILPIANGGTNSGTALDGSSIIISDGTSIIQGEKGTTTTVLHGNGSGAPSYGQVVNNDIADGTIDLTSKVVNELPVVNGGTGLTTFGGNNTVLYTSAANNLTNVATSTAAGQFLQTTTSGGAPTWKSVLDVVNGGLGQSSPLVPGGVLYGSTATAAGVTAAGFTGQMLRSTGAGTPIWSTPTYPNSATLGKIMRGDGTNWLETTTTYPNSTTINQLLYSPSDNNIAGLATLNNGVLVTNGTGVPQWANRTDFTSSALTDGHIYVGNSSDVATDVAMSGDATIINSGAVTVGRINGATVPVSGALITGNVLQVDGINSTTYAPVNVGGGVNFVTGILPIANGGTNSGAALVNGRVMVSRGDKIVEAGVMNNGQVIVGSTGIEPQIVTMAGDITIDNAGATTIGAGKVLNGMLGADAVTTDKVQNGTLINADISATAGIDAPKLIDGSVSNTELGYINSLTSNAQTQIDSKQTATLADGRILIGNVSNIATAVLPAGDVTISNTGVTTIGTGTVTTGKILDETILNQDIADGTINLTEKVTGLLPGTNGGTGVNNGTKLITVGGNFTTSPANNLTLTTTGSTNVTLPVTGTLATLAGNEALSNKTINGLTPASLANGFSITGGTIPATLTVPSDATVSGSNSGDVSLAGQNYLSLAGQVITANPVDLSGTNASGVLAAARFPALTGDVTTTVGTIATTLANTAVTPGSYGNSTQVGTFTVDSKGRLTAAANVTITGAAPTGLAGGDLSGLYPNPTVSRINGATVPVSGALVTGNVLQVDGISSTTYAPVNVGGGVDYISGILPISNGGTNSGTALINNRLMISRGGQIVELFGLNDGQLVVGKTGNEPQVVTMNGDVTISSLGAATVGNVGGSAAVNINTATLLANASTNANTASTIVRRDASGNFIAGTITAALNGNATTATNAGSFTGSLVGDVTGTQGATVVSTVGGSTATNVNAATVLANASTNANTASTIVRRDASGNFTAGTITAALNGNAATATLASTVTTNANLTGMVTSVGNATTVVTNANLTGPITSTGNATAVASQTGTGSTFVMNNTPTLITPNVGAATGTSLTATGTLSGSQLTSTIATGTAPLVVTSTTPVANLSIGGNAATVTTNANLTGMVTSVGNATTVVTNANLTGPITSVGNATSVASQTGTGSTFVMNNTPTLITPNIGAATGTSLTATGALSGSQLTSTIATGTAPLVVTSTTPVANLSIGGNAATATTAGTVTTNANLTGPITSVGNATSVASQTGTGSTFVMNNTPTLITPNIGAATGTSLTATGALSGSQLTSTVATGTAPLVVTSTTPVANLNIGGNAATVTTNANLTGMVTSVGNTTTVVTNANLTGPITSVGNATSVASQTGTGSTFVMNNTPTLITPNIGAATGTSLTATGALSGSQLTSTIATGTAPLVVTSTTPVANLSIGGNAATATTAGTVTTNANLTGPITSVGNATSVASQTGTGSTFVMNNTPTLITPNIGAATGTSLTATGALSGSQLTSTIATGTAPLVVTSTTPVANLSIGGNAATATTAGTVTTNANLTGPITSVGNATSVASQTGTGSTFVMNNTPILITPNIGAATGTSLTATGALSGSQLTSTVATGTAPLVVTSTTPVANLSIGGNAATATTAGTVTTNANLTGMVTSIGNATTVVTNANLTGEVTSVGNATTVTNAAVISKLLTGYVSGAGAIVATDNILQAIQKLNGNDATNANLTGDVTSVGNATTLATVNTLTPGTYGNGTSVPTITVNGKGLVTASSATAIAFPVTLAGSETLTNKTLTSPVLTTPVINGTITGTTVFPIANGGTGQTTAANAFNALSPITTLGDLIYGSGVNTSARLAGNITASTMFLRQTGTGAVSSAPVWASLSSTDVGLGNVPNIDATNAGNISSGVLAVARGGTGSATQNFVDLTTGQTVAGAKTWSNLATFNTGLTAVGPINLNNNASGDGVNIGTSSNTGTIVIGGSTGNQTISVGNGPAVKTLSLGSNTTTSTTTILSGTSAGVLSLNASAGAAVTNIGTGTTSGTVLIGGAAANQAVAITSGGTGTLNLNNNTGAASPVNIGTGTSTGTVTIGNTTGNINLPKLTASRPVKTDGSKNLISGTIDLTTSNDVSGTLPITNGGTGSATQNFVDLTTAQTVGGTKTFSSLPAFSTLTAGSIPFAAASGQIAQDNANLFWNNTTKRLGIGTAAPSATLTVLGDVNIDATGSTTATPRTIGINPWGPGNAARYTFGDPWNSLQNGYGQRMQIVGYWGVEIVGHRENNTIALPFQGGGGGDASLNVIGTLAAAPVLTVTSAAGQTGNLQEWRNSGGTALASVNAAGNITSTGSITSSGQTSGIGYTAGAGGTVNQPTSKSNAVTINRISGQITMDNATLNAGQEVSFIVNNSTVASTDVPVIAISSGASSNTYYTSITAVANGTFRISLTNASTTNKSEYVVINFVIIKGANN